MEKRTTTINGEPYSIIVPPVMRSMSLSTRTGVLIGPLLGGLFQKGTGTNLTSFSNALAGVDPEKLDKLLMDAVFAGKLTHDITPICDEISFERHFSEHRSSLYQVCVWALWEIVKDFFPELGAFTQRIKEYMKAPGSESQTGGVRTTG